MVEQATLCARPVADRHRREVGTVGFAGLWVRRGRSRRAVAGAGDIGANDVVVGGVDGLAGADDVAPPRPGLPRCAGGVVAGDVLTAGQGVTDEHGVVTGELAVGLVGDLQFGDRLAALEAELAEFDGAAVDLSRAHSLSLLCRRRA